MTVDSQVLVVDDEAAAAHTFAELIERKTRLQTVVATSPDEALDLAKKSSPLVLVLDQKMPGMPGTELFSHLRRLLPNAAAIMLTQEEDDAKAAQTATNLGYRYHMHKSQIVDLPAKVLELYIEAVGKELASDAGPQPRRIWTRKHWFGMRGSHELLLISSESIEERHVSETDWRAYVTVNAGQSITHETRATAHESIRLETTDSEELAFSGGITIPASSVGAGLKAALAHQQRTETLSELGTVDRLEETFNLPPEPADPNQLHVKTRQFELAPVFQRLRTTMALRCSSCGQDSKLVVGVLVPTDLVALRHTDYLSDKSTRVIETGFRSVG